MLGNFDCRSYLTWMQSLQHPCASILWQISRLTVGPAEPVSEKTCWSSEYHSYNNAPANGQTLLAESRSAGSLHALSLRREQLEGPTPWHCPSMGNSAKKMAQVQSLTGQGDVQPRYHPRPAANVPELFHEQLVFSPNCAAERTETIAGCAAFRP